jgi:hypothetical protein
LRDAFLINFFKDCKFDLRKVNIVVACVTDTTGDMSKFGRLLEDEGVSHIFCADHVLQLTAKKAYLDSWFNAGTNAVTLDDAELLVLDEVHDLDTMKKASHLVEHFRKSNQQLAKLLELNRITWAPIMKNRLLLVLSLMLSQDGGLLTLCENA